MDSIINYAFLSAWVYNNQRGEPNKIELVPQWELLGAGSPLSGSGFTAQAFKNGNEIVIAFKGTDFLIGSDNTETLADLTTDLLLGVGFGADQLIEAVHYYSDIYTQYGSNANITFTGHSLGAGLASIMSVWFNKGATVFADAPFKNAGLNLSLIKSISESSWINPSLASDLKNLIIVQDNPGGITQPPQSLFLNQVEYDSRQSNVASYYVEGEMLNAVFGGYSTIVGNNNPIAIGGGGSVSGATLHAMNLHAALLIEDQLRQDTLKLPSLITQLFDADLYARPLQGDQADFLTHLVRDQFNKGYASPDGLLYQFAIDVGNLDIDVVSSRPQLQKSLIAAAIEDYYFMQNGFTHPLFSTSGNSISIDLPSIGEYASKSTPLVMASIQNMVGQDYDLMQLHNENQYQVTIGDISNNNLSTTSALLAVGQEKNDFINGSSQGDILYGGSGSDQIFGGGGNDILIGGGGNDYLQGGIGADIYYVRNGDTVEDADGLGDLKFVDLIGSNDFTYQMSSNDLIIGYNFDKTIKVKNYKNFVLGINFDKTPNTINQILNDRYIVTDSDGNSYELARNDLITGSDANDEIRNVSLGSDTINAGAGNDSIYALGTDFINPGTGNDTLIFNSYPSLSSISPTIKFSAGDGLDTITNYHGAEVVDNFNFDLTNISLADAKWYGFMAPGNNVNQLRFDVRTKSGEGFVYNSITRDATIFTLNFNDGSVNLNSQNFDVFNDLNSPKYQFGTQKSDVIQSSVDVDFLYGFDGNDNLTAINGSQTLDGGAGVDILDGGAGRDTYVFGSGYGSDTIRERYIDAVGGNTLKLVNVDPNDISISHRYYSGGSTAIGMDLKIRNTQDSLFVDGYFIDRIEFDNGQVWSAEDILSRLGSGRNDQLSNGSNGGLLMGGSGNDRLEGSIGSDTYVFNTGDGQDVIIAKNTQSDVDKLKFGFGISSSNLTFTNSNDSLIVRVGTNGDQITFNNWYLADNFGLDSINFTDGSEMIGEAVNSAGLIKYGTGADDNLNGTSSKDDIIFGLSGNDTLIGNGGDDTLDGGDGDDVLFGGAGSDNLIGGTGNDSLYAHGIDDNYERFELTSNRLAGGAGNDNMYGSIGGDTYVFNLGDGTDSIYESTYETDYVSGIDRILMGTGILPDDVSLIQSGNDLRIKVGNSGDEIRIKNWATESARIEELVFVDGTVWNKSDLHRGYLTLNDDDFPGYLTGKNNEGDFIYGNGGNDYIDGLSGNDYLDGGTGSDELHGGDGADVIVGGTGADVLYGDNGADTYVFTRGDGAEIIYEEGYDGAIDTLRFQGDINVSDLITLNNEQGDLILFLGSGDQITIKNWYVDQQYQVEKFIFSDGTILNKSDLPTPQLGTFTQYGTSGNDFIQSIDFGGINEIYGLDGNDTLFGGFYDDVLNGGVGNDYLRDTWGTNTIIGGLGDDILEGGGSDDTYLFNIGDGVDTIYESSKGSLQDQIEFGLGLNISNLSFQQLDNDLMINVGAGGDQIIVKYWFYGSKIETLKFANGAVLNLLTGSPSGGDIFGSASNDIVLGFNGDDVLTGGDGTDILIGGPGNDSYIVDSTTDSIIENAVGGVDTVQSSVTYTLGASSNLENLTLTGTIAINATGNASDNVLIGNVANNTLNGGNGNDTLDGGAGVDTLIGGSGDDTFIIDSTTDTITEFSTGGIDTVQSSVAYTLGLNLENLTLTGTSNLSGFGNALNNTVIGNVGNNTLNGFGGIDTLMGGAGSDVYNVDTATDIIIENANEGTDTVRSDVSYVLGNNIENLILTAAGGAINGTGNTLSNAITGNSTANILDGGTGNDYLTGGDGNDTYIIDTTGDTIVESATGGVDTVQSTVTYTLGASSNLENLTLTGASAINGTGNSLSNFLLGNSGNNTLTDTAGGNDILQGLGGVDTFNDTSGNNLLDGGIGADVITAGGGSDVIIGGIGSDTFTTGTGYDVILFNKGDGADTINASVGSDNTLSLGGNFAYSDLSLTKSTNDLILKIGATDQITLKGWYNTAANNKTVLNLQVIAEAAQGFSLGGSDTLRNNKVETFSFANLVSAFDAAGATANWQLTDARLMAHLSAGSDAAAIGGDIAYQYGKAGSLTGVGLLAAQAVMSNASVGQSAQTLNASSSWAAETIKLL